MIFILKQGQSFAVQRLYHRSNSASLAITYLLEFHGKGFSYTSTMFLFMKLYLHFFWLDLTCYLARLSERNMRFSYAESDARSSCSYSLLLSSQNSLQSVPFSFDRMGFTFSPFSLLILMMMIDLSSKCLQPTLNRLS